MRERWTRAAVLAARPRLRGVLHQVGFFVSLVAGPVLVLRAQAEARAVVAVYVVSLSGLLGVSALYHRGRWAPRTRALLRRIDHTMIFLLIAGTYTPVVALALPSGQTQTLLLVVVWIGALLGIALRLLWPNAPNPVIAALYLLLGWTAVLALPQLYGSLSAIGFALLVSGGLAYTIGAVVYALRRPNPLPSSFGYHEVFHAFVVLGAACHYVTVASVSGPMG